MKKPYTRESEHLMTVKESTTTYGATPTITHYSPQATLDAETASELFATLSNRFGRDYAEKMKERNFLFGAPQPSNEEEFRNLDDMFEDAELSGVCTDQEFQKLFAAWN